MKPSFWRRLSRALALALVGSVPGLGLIAATAAIQGEVELQLGLAGSVSAAVGAGVGASWGWLGRPPVTVMGVAVVMVLAILFLFGGLLGRSVALIVVGALVVRRAVR